MLVEAIIGLSRYPIAGLPADIGSNIAMRPVLGVQGRFSFYMTSHGEEATAIGSAAALTLEDTVSLRWPRS